MPTRRSFLGQSVRLLGGAVLVGPPLLAACGGDDDDDAGATTTAGGAAATTAAGTAPSTGGSIPAASGTVRTAFNWVPDIEWSAWYLADSNGLFSGRGVTTPPRSQSLHSARSQRKTSFAVEAMRAGS